MMRQALVRLGFRFPDEAQERLFVERFVLVHARTTQIFMAASAIMFALFFIWDREVDPVRWRQVFALREFIVTPLIFAGAAALLARPLRPYLEAIVTVVVTAALAAFTVICATLEHGFRYGAAGMLLIYFAGAAMFPVRLIFLTAPNAAMLLGFLGLQIWARGATASMLAVNILVIVTAVVIGSMSAAGRELAGRREFQTDLALAGARERVDDLLHSMMPREIVRRIQAGETTIADIHGEVSIVFADLVGFTALSRTLNASELVQMLNQVFSRFDAAAGRLGVEKIKTIGDAYMAVGGLATGDEARAHAERMADFALAMRDIAAEVAADTGLPVAIRVGLHVGPVVAGVIGTKKPAFDCWGDAVNMASRLENACRAGAVLISQPAYDRLSGRFQLEAAPPVDLKGIGPSAVYLLHGRLPSSAAAA